MKIIKRRRKKRPTYKYLKVYFELYGDTYCREWREDFFTRQKTETWSTLTIKIRREPKRGTTYLYENYEEIIPYDWLTKEFDKTYERYIFNLRSKKLKRI